MTATTLSLFDAGKQTSSQPQVEDANLSSHIAAGNHVPQAGEHYAFQHLGIGQQFDLDLTAIYWTFLGMNFPLRRSPFSSTRSSLSSKSPQASPW